MLVLPIFIMVIIMIVILKIGEKVFFHLPVKNLNKSPSLFQNDATCLYNNYRDTENINLFHRFYLCCFPLSVKKFKYMCVKRLSHQTEFLDE